MEPDEVMSAIGMLSYRFGGLYVTDDEVQNRIEVPAHIGGGDRFWVIVADQRYVKAIQLEVTDLGNGDVALQPVDAKYDNLTSTDANGGTTNLFDALNGDFDAIQQHFDNGGFDQFLAGSVNEPGYGIHDVSMGGAETNAGYLSLTAPTVFDRPEPETTPDSHDHTGHLPSGDTMSIVAHVDDDLLFMNPDIQASIDAGNGHTAVFLVGYDNQLSGEAGQQAWMDREMGMKLAYSNMTGSTQWVDSVATFSDGTNSFDIATSYLEDQPDVRLYFLRINDGNIDGRGFANGNYQSLMKLWEGQIDEIGTVDGSNSFTAEQLTGILAAIMERHQPEVILRQDHETEYVAQDHSGHTHASLFTDRAQELYDTPHETVSVIGYATAEMPENLTAEEAAETYQTVYEHARFDPTVRSHFDADGNPVVRPLYVEWTQRHYHTDDVDRLSDPFAADSEVSLWDRDLTVQSGGWTPGQYPLSLGDINGDGRADLVGFGHSYVHSALSTGQNFGALSRPLNDFSYSQGWRVGEHDRMMGDVDGDGRDDIIGFGYWGANVALSNGTGFFASSLWSRDYGTTTGWSASSGERLVADVNGDGRDDVVAFGADGVTVSLSTGSSFARGQGWSQEFGRNDGWDVARDERLMADVNGDGRADIVGFGADGVHVSLSTGSGFGASARWMAEGSANSAWNGADNDRHMADVNGDGLDDIVSYGDDGVYVALSNGSGFDAAERWSTDFSNDSGWGDAAFTRMVEDVNGDGKADLVGVGRNGVYVASSDGSSFDGPTAYPDAAAYSFVPEDTETPEDPDLGLPSGMMEFTMNGLWVTGDGVSDRIELPDTLESGDRFWIMARDEPYAKAMQLEIVDLGGDAFSLRVIAAKYDSDAVYERLSGDFEAIQNHFDSNGRDMVIAANANEVGYGLERVTVEGLTSGPGYVLADEPTVFGDPDAPVMQAEDTGAEDAADPAAAALAEVTYSLGDSPDGFLFDIDPESGAVTPKDWFQPSLDEAWDADSDYIYEITRIATPADGSAPTEERFRLDTTAEGELALLEEDPAEEELSGAEIMAALLIPEAPEYEVPGEAEEDDPVAGDL